MQVLCSQNQKGKIEAAESPVFSRKMASIKPAAESRQNVALHTLLLLGCLTVSGCSSAYQPVWHRDSQSFFYACRDGEVFQYDLKSKTSRSLLKPSKKQYQQVALHPDADLIAAAAMTTDGDGSAVDVEIVSFTEEKEAEHTLKRWRKPTSHTEILPTQCDWCPSGKRILIWAEKWDFHLFRKSPKVSVVEFFAVYDVASRQISKLPEQDTVPPAVDFGNWLGVSILCPDGSSYISYSSKEPKSGFAVVSWEAQTRRVLKEDVVSQEILERLSNPDMPEKERMKIFYPMPQGVWQENTLHFVTRQGQFFMDVTEVTIRTEPLTQHQQQEFDRIDLADAAEGGWITTQVVPLKAGQTSLHCRGRENEFRLELVNESDNQRQVVILPESYSPVNFLAHQLFPSPDGQHVLVPLWDNTEKTGIIVILDAEGTLYDQVELGDYSDPNDPFKREARTK